MLTPRPPVVQIDALLVQQRHQCMRRSLPTHFTQFSSNCCRCEVVGFFHIFSQSVFTCSCSPDQSLRQIGLMRHIALHEEEDKKQVFRVLTYSFRLFSFMGILDGQAQPFSRMPLYYSMRGRKRPDF
jgi:hypothetical protein